MEFLRRQQQAALGYARKTLREIVEAHDSGSAARLRAIKDETLELLKQGRAVEDSPPDSEEGVDPADTLRRQYRAAVYRVRQIAREMVESHEAKDAVRFAAAKVAARQLLGLRRP